MKLRFSLCVLMICGSLSACVSAPIEPTQLNKKATAFGEPHANAPPQLTEFGRLAGSWSCAVNERRSDGSWRNRPDKISWTWFYTLNGMAVQDIWSSEDKSNQEDGIATNLRIYDSVKQSWNVSWTNTTQATFELWSGVREGDEIVLNSIRDGRPVKIRFYNILPRQFQWSYDAATNRAGSAFTPVMQLLCQRQG